MSHEFGSNEVEQRAIAVALGLLVAVADAGAAKVRLEQLVAATAEHDAKLVAVDAAIAEVGEKARLWKEADAGLSTRISEFQSWVDRTEASYRQREDRVRANEIEQERRGNELASKESDLDRRVSAHEQRLQSLKATLS
jgi:hypothetical protein